MQTSPWNNVYSQRTKTEQSPHTCHTSLAGRCIQTHTIQKVTQQYKNHSTSSLSSP